MLENTVILKLEECIKNKINRIFLTQLLYQQKTIKVDIESHLFRIDFKYEFVFVSTTY